MQWTIFWQPTVHAQQNTSECLMTHCASNNWPIWTQKVPKETEICKLKSSLRTFSKIFCCTWTVGCQKCVHYISMLCTVCFILNGIVSVQWYQFHTNSEGEGVHISRYHTILLPSQKNESCDVYKDRTLLKWFPYPATKEMYA